MPVVFKPTNPQVNLIYWYDEQDIQKVLTALISTSGKMKLSNPTAGIILKSDDTLYSVQDTSFSVGYDFIIDVQGIESTSKLERLSTCLENIIDWNKSHLNNSKFADIIRAHKILLPLNIGRRHWIVFELLLSFDQIDANFYLNKLVTFNLYDSVNRPMNVARYFEAYLEPLLQKFKVANDKLEFKINLPQIRKQSDANSCGPITTQNIWNLIQGINITSSNISYSRAEIYDLRMSHLTVVNDPAFTAKQQDLIEVGFKPMLINGNTSSQACALFNFIQQELSDEESSKAMQMLKELTYLTAKITQSDDDLAKMENVDQKYRAQMAEVKLWFKKYYEQLSELNLVQNIFNLKIDDNPSENQAENEEDKLIWMDGGQDTLTEIMEKMFTMPANVKGDYNLSVGVAIEFDDYTFIGFLNYSNQPDGVCLEKFITDKEYRRPRSTPDKYYYKGSFIDGLRADGIEKFKSQTLPMDLYFDGMRDYEEKPLAGKICAFMGYLGYDNPVIYKGEIVDGKMHSENALLFMLNKHQQIHTTVSAKFEAGQITRIFTIKQKTSVSTLLFSCIGVEPNDLRYMQKINQFLSKYGKRLQTKLDEALCRRVREDYLNLYMTYYAGLPDYLKITPIEIYQKHKLVEITTEDPDDKSLSPRPKNFLPFCS